jgi:hypothetical protein
VIRPRTIERVIRGIEAELRSFDRCGGMQQRPGAHEERELVAAALAAAKGLASSNPSERRKVA